MPTRCASSRRARHTSFTAPPSRAWTRCSRARCARCASISSAPTTCWRRRSQRRTRSSGSSTSRRARSSELTHTTCAKGRCRRSGRWGRRAGRMPSRSSRASTWRTPTTTSCRYRPSPCDRSTSTGRDKSAVERSARSSKRRLRATTSSCAGTERRSAPGAMSTTWLRRCVSASSIRARSARASISATRARPSRSSTSRSASSGSPAVPARSCLRRWNTSTSSCAYRTSRRLMRRSASTRRSSSTTASRGRSRGTEAGTHGACLTMRTVRPAALGGARPRPQSRR